MEYLGFIVSKDSVATNPAKIKAIIDWPQPKNVRQVRGFLGITGWYRSFIEAYAKVAAALTKLLKKSFSFKWSKEAQQSFEDLKQKLVTAPVLKLPDFSKPFVVTTDASAIAIGGVLQQEGQPIAYESRKLKDHEKNYATHDLELLGVVHALKIWRRYLLGNTFEICTNHKSLKWIFT